MNIPVIGVDCSTNPAKVGLARATWSDGTLTIDEVTSGGKKYPSRKWPMVVRGWLGDSADALIALDAPLGWPIALSRALRDHRAGGRLSDDVTKDSDLMFLRLTDLVIHRTLRKKPIEVGANLIARTARDALVHLDSLRSQCRDRGGVSLARTPGHGPGIRAIEVYPAATLLSRRLPIAGYKGEIRSVKRNKTVARERQQKARNTALRKTRGDLLSRLLDLEVVDVANNDIVNEATRSDDILDAVVCCVAARDFLGEEVISPEDPEVARIAEKEGRCVDIAAEKEGWIWVKRPQEATPGPPRVA